MFLINSYPNPNKLIPLHLETRRRCAHFQKENGKSSWVPISRISQFSSLSSAYYYWFNLISFRDQSIFAEETFLDDDKHRYFLLFLMSSNLLGFASLIILQQEGSAPETAGQVWDEIFTQSQAATHGYIYNNLTN